MKAALFDEVIIQVFIVRDGDDEYKVTHNPDWNTEDNPDANPFVPEFIVQDSTGAEVEKGCQIWNEAVQAVKGWHEI